MICAIGWHRWKWQETKFTDVARKWTSRSRCTRCGAMRWVYGVQE